MNWTLVGCVLSCMITLSWGKCPEGFYVDLSIPEGDPCSPWKKSGESCKNSTECNQSQLLECFTGICQCNPKTSVFQQETPGELTPNSSQGKCVGRVGSKCSSDTPCMSSAECSSSGSCSCKSEFTPTSDNLCGRNFQESCSKIQVCKDGLVCLNSMRHGYDAMDLMELNLERPELSEEKARNSSTIMRMFQQKRTYNVGTCRCNAKYETYDFSTMTCKALAGAPCDNSTKQCVSNAICMEKESPSLAQCECKPGFVESSQGECDIEHGKQCSFMTVDPTKQAKCDRLAQLVCKKGFCSCQSSSDSYDALQRRCVGAVGSRCQEDRDCISGTTCVHTNANNRRLWRRMGRCGKA